MDSLVRELKFALRDRVVLLTLLGISLLSSYSVISGLKESVSEKSTIERVKSLVSEDREHNLAKQSDAGGAAYYAFHFTYDAPADLAFVSRGIRDDLPWKHRIRMLALEGQIYETDLLVVGGVALNVIFWCLITLAVSSRIESGPTTAALLLGCWLILAVVIPIGGKFFVEQTITVPKGGEILLRQREVVNNGWDLPKEATMAPFLERHPQWNNSPKVTRPFEWKWYYAFQQVGDQSVEHLSEQLRSGITRRDNAMKLVSLASPPLLTKRLLTRAANTDIAAFQRYDGCVRDFHLSLREFHYPMLFGNVEYSPDQMRGLPAFAPCTGRIQG